MTSAIPKQALSELRDAPRAPEVKIIRASEENAWRDAYRLLAEAKDVYASEWERGYAEGLAEAVKEASKLVIETNAKTHGYLASLEKEIAGLAFDIIRRVLNNFSDAELVAQAARNALADFRDAKALRIKVHPTAEVRVRRTLSEYASVHGDEWLSVIVETGDGLPERTCILSTEYAVVEATIDTQLSAIAAAMGLKGA